MAADRETPVYGLSGYPTAHYAVPQPKIAIYAGASVPTNLLFPGSGNGHCTSTAFCEALFTLAKEDGIPVNAVNGLIRPITTAEIVAGGLVTVKENTTTHEKTTTPNFTALVSPGTEIAAGTAPNPAEKLQEFVNAGGNFVGYGEKSATSLRNAAISKLNTASTATWNAHCPDNNEPDRGGQTDHAGDDVQRRIQHRRPGRLGLRRRRLHLPRLVEHVDRPGLRPGDAGGRSSDPEPPPPRSPTPPRCRPTATSATASNPNTCRVGPTWSTRPSAPATRP